MAIFPQTPVATAALSVATRFYSPALLNHCVRSYLWGTMYGAAHGIAFDDELYYVSAMLHDIGLTDHRQSPSAVRGGGRRPGLGVRGGGGWPAEQAARATEIIVLHMRDDVASTADPESHILQVATSWDVVGRRPEEFSAEVRAEILSRYPRQGFGDEFLACSKTRRDASPAAPLPPRSPTTVPDASRPTLSTARRASHLTALS